MFYDPDKRTMISVEMKKGVKVSDFAPIQQELIPELEDLVQQHGVDQEIGVDGTRIATDIAHHRTGKALGADRVLDWLTQNQIDPSRHQFITIGDSASDVQMAYRLAEEGLPVQFVYVGESEQLDKLRAANPPFEIVGTQGHCDVGTLEFLKSEK
jgi:hypothetical protein